MRVGTKQYNTLLSPVLVLPNGFGTGTAWAGQHMKSSGREKPHSMTWTTQHLRFPGRQSWGEDYQGHEDKQSRGMRLGGSRHQAQRKRAILPWRATVKVKTHTEKADRVNCTKGKKEVSLGRVRPWLGRGASGWLLVKEVGQSWLIRA